VEEGWMEQQPNLQELSALLESGGWTLQWQRWREPLDFSLTEGLLERWLGAEAPYRRQLSEVLTPTQIKTLRQELASMVGCRLPQHLEHHQLVAQQNGLCPRAKAVESTSDASAPGGVAPQE